jgi:hypothetical protein
MVVSFTARLLLWLLLLLLVRRERTQHRRRTLVGEITLAKSAIGFDRLIFVQ